MVGLPSGLERVRWNEFGQLAAALDHAENFGAARLRGLEAFQHQRAGAFRHHEAVAVLGERLRRRACGGSFEVESAESSEKRISDSAFTEPSVPMQSAASVSPRRIASTPSWIAVAPEAQAVESEIGEPLVPNFSADRSATEPNRKRS